MNEQARRAIVSYTTCQKAERAVDHLSDQGFPVERVIGQDVRLVEQVTGHMRRGGAALPGAASGALSGALLGWIFGLPNWLDPVVSALLLAMYGLVFGALAGALLGLQVYAAQRGRRDFASVSFMQPSRYDGLASGTGTGTSSEAWKGSCPRRGSAVT